MHGGTVAVRSAGTGRGSEFIVRLPIRQPAPTAAPGDAAAS
jgi:two-component system CheB/CheR fusion protein